ncbi:MAG: acyltransferase domain-containing protein [Myxococcales bacterium]|nr:acyltransferase domain-containing protein [Myxococcales bacterium]
MSGQEAARRDPAQAPRNPADVEPTSGPARAPNVPIAIVGIGCRYADARGPAEFWEIVRSGRNTVRDAPDHRIELGYDIDHFYDPRPRIPGKISSKKAGFLEHPELFDPAAFGIAPRDALTMEPQQRLMVEVTWDALEDAGIVPASIAGERVAVILGYMAEDYSRERTGVLGEEAVFRGHDVFTVGGMSHAVLSGRISFLLGVTGPSLTLDTACSSSLYATHLACESLRRGESTMAIAGGVNLFLSPEGNIALSRSGMLSMSGACKAFDASADGFVRAEGAGIVVLRPLADALADGNPIYAVIRGSGISADGRDGGHMMAPGRRGQAQAMRDAYSQAGIEPSDVQYVETHGTGTMIGDPVEIGALADVMGPGRPADRPLRVASVKGNLGHSESASGVAGLIRAALSIQHRELHAQMHFETPNPAIAWDTLPVRVQDRSEPWPWPGRALVGVNSFGISGTNAHVILESAPEAIGALPAAATASPASAAEASPLRLVPISGHHPDALHEGVERQVAALAPAMGAGSGTTDEGRPDFADLSHTLSLRRAHRVHRLAVVAGSNDGLRAELEAWLAGEASGAVVTGVASERAAAGLAMVFPGQGAQWVGMGRELLASEPVFAEAIDRLDDAYAQHVDWSLRRVLEGREDVDWTTRLDVLQPVLVAVEIALAALWEGLGVRPARVVGQSLGEIAAAHVAGCLDLEDTARLACERGRVVAMASGAGAMGVVARPRDEIEAAIRAADLRVEVAGTSSPTTTIVSGDREDVVALIDVFEARGVFARRLDVDFASHCFHMDPLLETFRERIRGLRPQPGRVPFDSTVDGETKSGPELDVDYWVRNLREAVAFDLGLARSLKGGARLFVEVSPHPALARPIAEIAAAQDLAVEVVGSLQRAQDERRAMLQSLARLFVLGVDVAFDALNGAGRVVRTPLYAYQRERYWFATRTRQDRFRPTHPLLGRSSQSSVDPRLHVWDFVLDADSAGFVGDARIDGVATLPVALHVELALAAADALWSGAPVAIRGLEPRAPLVLPGPPAGALRREVQVVVEVEGERRGRFRVSSRTKGGAWQLHATGRIDPAQRATQPDRSSSGEALAFEAADVAAHVAMLEAGGLASGPRSRCLRELERSVAMTDAAPARKARLMLPRTIEAEWQAFFAHPALVEEALLLAGSLFEAPAAPRVVRIDAIELDGALPSDCRCRVERLRRRETSDDGPERIEVAIAFVDREGRSIGRIDGLHVEARAAGRAQIAHTRSGLHVLGWRPLALAATNAERSVDHWLIVSDSAVEAGLLEAELRKDGASTRFCAKREDLAAVLARLRAESGGRFGFLLLAWGDEHEASEGGEPPDHRAFRVGSWVDAIRALHAEAAECWIATRGLQPVAEAASDSPATAHRVAQEIEHFASCAELQQCRLFDASGALGQADRIALASLLGRGGRERHFVARGGEIRVPRLVPLEDPSQAPVVGAGSIAATRSRSGRRPTERPAGDRDFRAVHAQHGGLESIAFVETSAPVPTPGSVVVAVQSVALGQPDALTALGLARAAAGDTRGAADDGLGLSFAGIVRAVGDADSRLRPGDAVMGVAKGALASRLVVPEAHLVPRPPRLDVHAAAALPFAHLVARHALETVARLRSGERVLVACGAGGVGLVTVRLARMLGASVTAIASTSQARAALEDAGAAVLALESAHAREGGADEASALAAAGPFDVIVGSTSGARLHALVERLDAGGRYVDLYPRDRFERPEVGALRLAANRSYAAVDAIEIVHADVARVAELLARLPDAVSQAGLERIPRVVFPVGEASRALHYLIQGRHTGRVCLDLEGASEVAIRGPAGADRLLAGRGVFRVGGDEPGLQQAIADRLRARGADRVELVGEAATADDAAGLAGWVHVASSSSVALDDALGSSDRPALDPQAPDVAHGALAPLGFLVSLREDPDPSSGDDRAWESRLWVDRLRLAAPPGHSRVLGLSVARGGETESVLQVLDRFLAEELEPGQVVWLDDEALRRRLAGPASPWLCELARGVESGADGSPLRSELLGLARPERRAAMRRVVRDALAGVLGLSQEARLGLDLDRSLPSVGLDSLMTLELFVGLGRDLELEIGPDWFGVEPSLSGVANVLADRLGGAGGRA